MEAHKPLEVDIFLDPLAHFGSLVAILDFWSSHRRNN